MSQPASFPPRPWGCCLRSPVVWRQAVRFGLPVGLLQAALNQGDLWLHQQVTPIVVAKTVVSPLLSLAVALLATAATHRRIQPPHSPPTP